MSHAPCPHISAFEFSSGSLSLHRSPKQRRRRARTRLFCTCLLRARRRLSSRRLRRRCPSSSASQRASHSTTWSRCATSTLCTFNTCIIHISPSVRCRTPFVTPPPFLALVTPRFFRISHLSRPDSFARHFFRTRNSSSVQGEALLQFE